MRAFLAGHTDYVIVILTICVASVLVLSNLGNHHLWQDEAETALISETILTHGLPLGYDGTNYFSQLGGDEYGKHYIWRLHPWFQFYLLAAFYAIFGVSTFVSRLPFALFGIATVVLVYYLALALWKSRRAAVFAAVLLLLSVPFMLLVRQCRYYSPSMFFALLMLYAYLGLVEGRRHAGKLLALSSVLLFQTQYVGFAAAAATLILHSLLFNRSSIRRFLTPAAITLGLILVWMYVALVTLNPHKPMHHVAASLDLEDIIIRAGAYAQRIVGYIFPPVLLIVPFAVIAVRSLRRKSFVKPSFDRWQEVILLLIFAAFQLAFSAVVFPAPFFRYLAPLIPVSCLLMALTVESAASVHVLVPIALSGLLIHGQPLPYYVYELTHDFDGPEEGIVNYLNAHGSKNDIVAITHGDLPIKFYTGMKVIGGMTGEDLSPIRKARWVIMRKHVITAVDENVGVYFMTHVDDTDFRSITLPYSDTPFENREDPEEHYFETAGGMEPVVIFERTRRP